MIVVFDIDGTLTPAPSAVLEVRDAAVATVTAWERAGAGIVYLSARPIFVEGFTGYWLRREGFPEGKLFEASDLDCFHPAAFKTRILGTLEDRIFAAYGDMASDFQAYATASIEHVFALLHRGAFQCEPGQYEACLDEFSENHLRWVNEQSMSGS